MIFSRTNRPQAIYIRGRYRYNCWQTGTAMQKTLRLISLVVVLLALLGGAVACKSSPSTPVDETAVRAYADPATETTLQGLSEDNLAKYTQYADAAFKAAVTQEILDKTSAQITGKIGKYVSKEFLRAEDQGIYTVVHYKATYESGETGVRMVFDQDHLVAGQWFE